jgi:hypothetical protein
MEKIQKHKPMPASGRFQPVTNITHANLYVISSLKTMYYWADGTWFLKVSNVSRNASFVVGFAGFMSNDRERLQHVILSSSKKHNKTD